MDWGTEREIEMISRAADDVVDTLDTAIDDGAPPEVIEEARRLMADFQWRYNNLLERLKNDERLRVQRTLANKVDRMKTLYDRLR